jgi:peptidyl-prolyl cis-trans isomerase-like 4
VVVAGTYPLPYVLPLTNAYHNSFLKLCKVKYYNFSPIHSVQKNFSFQTGDPLGPLALSSNGGTSIWGLLSSKPEDRTFPAFFHPKLKHLERGTVSMATAPMTSDPDTRLAASQFLITLGDKTDFLDGKAAIFGRVVEGFDTLEKINEAIVDERGYPLVDIRIQHTIILDDPFPDPAELREPSASPKPTAAQLATVRIGADENLSDHSGDEAAAAAADRKRKEREAAAQALTLEIMGDLPFADVKPPENVLFVCKLNPVTSDADLELIFSRFGKVLSCEVVRDRKTGDSLQYAFVEFEEKSAAERAYFKMQNVLIDDRRIHVDFSQSVSKLSGLWRQEMEQKRRGGRNGHSRHAGGWGGVQELEKRRKYREEEDHRDDDDDDARYDLVYSDEELRGRHERQADRGRGPPDDGDRNGKDGRHDRQRDRDGWNSKDGGHDKITGGDRRERWKNDDTPRDDRRGWRRSRSPRSDKNGRSNGGGYDNRWRDQKDRTEDRRRGYDRRDRY